MVETKKRESRVSNMRDYCIHTHRGREERERESNKIRFKLVSNYSPAQPWVAASAVELDQL